MFPETINRSTAPSYGFFIMNRLGLDNLMADLTADMALQLTSDYIIYRDEKGAMGHQSSLYINSALDAHFENTF